LVATPNNCVIAAWLLEQEVEEVVMESTAILETSVGSAREVWKRYARSEKAQAAGLERALPGAINRGRRGRKRIPRCERLVKRASGRELTLSFGARCRTTSVANGDAEKYQLTRDRAGIAEHRRSSGRAHYSCPAGLGFAGASARVC